MSASTEVDGDPDTVAGRAIPAGTAVVGDSDAIPAGTGVRVSGDAE
jgi:hypothetical protein